jgi:hypothetical protein
MARNHSAFSPTCAAVLLGALSVHGQKIARGAICHGTKLVVQESDRRARCGPPLCRNCGGARFAAPLSLRPLRIPYRVYCHVGARSWLDRSPKGNFKILDKRVGVGVRHGLDYYGLPECRTHLRNLNSEASPDRHGQRGRLLLSQKVTNAHSRGFHSKPPNSQGKALSKCFGEA